MADLVNITKIINVPTKDLRVEVIQDLLHKTKKYGSLENEAIWTEITDSLWQHMRNGFNKLDDQLLCATCFYSGLRMTTKQEVYIKKTCTLIKNESNTRENDINADEPISLKISLLYGLFQSIYLTEVSLDSNKEELLKATFDLLIKKASEYSRYTFLVFKTIYSFKKVINTDFQCVIYSRNNICSLLTLVNHNWENPITGVRDQNRVIFKTLVSILDQDLFDVVLQKVNNFHWNKAKYLMLAEIIDQYKYNLPKLVTDNQWDNGLLYSLQKSGLVSAGTDMYCAVLKNLKSETEWCKIFLGGFLDIAFQQNIRTIENFSNYWCLTSFKRFPQLGIILLDHLSGFDISDEILFSFLCVLKQGNKLGVFNNTNMLPDYTDRSVKEALDNQSTHIRMTAFEIVCYTPRKSLKSVECNIILEYLTNNINSDCTVLRISMLNNFKYFATELNALFLNCYNDADSNYIPDFYKSLQEFIIYSLKLNGNYQRKITTVKLINILLSSISGICKKARNNKSNKVSIKNLLKESNSLILFDEIFISILFSLLKDPADDIRENTAQLLLDQYCEVMTPSLINHLIGDARICMKSKFFFQINCGQSIYRLVASFLVKEKLSDIQFGSLDDMFLLAFNRLLQEYELKRDIVDSIETGNQLHSLIGVIIDVLKVSKQTSYELLILKEKLPRLLEILEAVSNQFTWEEGTATSSDFSKMNDMIQNIISTSGSNPSDEQDLTKISGLQQIVLNCLWFNVKSSCDLASLLVHFMDDEKIEECQSCLKIIMHVLETSRHKGVIEAAGAALGRSIQHLTSLPENSALSNIPMSLLKSKMEELIFYTNMASVTRRGAGLSIMVHRIVSSDMKHGKPLFHCFMKTLLETCITEKECKDTPLEGEQKDLPKAIYIHFLTRVVIDSSLASDMMHYSVELAEIAFENLTSSHWQIRNAALQLYGALIPKLIGQKKASGSGDDTIATVACDEFRTHSPKLWKRIGEHLENTISNQDQVQAHSNAMPILNVLANLAKRYNFSFDTSVEKDREAILFKSLLKLLGSPIFTVRRLTANCIYNIFEVSHILTVLIQEEINSENFLHGCLILTMICKQDRLENEEAYELLINKFILLFTEKNRSYVCKQAFDEININNCLNSGVSETFAELKRNFNYPGVSYWANTRIRNYIYLCTWAEFPEIMKILLSERNFEEHCQTIKKRIKTIELPAVKLNIVYNILINFSKNSNSSVIWEILYEISTKLKITDNTISVCYIFKYLQSKEAMYSVRYAIPFLATKVDILSEENLLNLSNIIISLCDPKTSDVDMRHIAALANNELAKNFRILSDTVKVNALESAVILLQDEDEDIRNASIHFLRHLKKGKVTKHSFICLIEILEQSFLATLFDDPDANVPILHEKLLNILVGYMKNETDDYNPFASDSKNIYFEVNMVRCLLQKINMK